MHRVCSGRHRREGAYLYGNRDFGAAVFAITQYLTYAIKKHDYVVLMCPEVKSQEGKLTILVAPPLPHLLQSHLQMLMAEHSLALDVV